MIRERWEVEAPSHHLSHLRSMSAKRKDRPMGYVSDTVMNEGKVAKVAGRSMEASPYPVGSRESVDWLAGYTFSEAEQNVAHEEPSGSNRS